MRKLFLLLAFFSIIGCSEDDTIQDETNEEVSIDTKMVTINIILPQNSTLNTDNLILSSLFTESESITDGKGEVEVFVNDGMEIVLVTDNEDNLIMMRYINPAEGDEFTIDSKTTAQTVAMFHPWSMHLSAQAKQEAFEEIAMMPGFEAYHNIIISYINNYQETNILENNEVLSAIDDFQGTILNRDLEINKLPLIFSANSDNITITNKKSSLAYNLIITDENIENVGDAYVLNGINKELISWNTTLSLLQGNFDIFQPTEISFPTPTATQQYSLRADPWQGDAAWINGNNITSKLIGIFSTSLAGVYNSLACGAEIGNLFVGYASFIIQQLNNGDITIGEALTQIFTLMFDNSQNLYKIVTECSNLNTTSAAFKKMVKKLSIIGNLENGAVLFFYMFDLTLYDTEIDFCFEKTNEGVEECTIDLTGIWKMTYTTSNCTLASPGEYILFEFSNGNKFTVLDDTVEFNIPKATYSIEFNGLELSIDMQASETNTWFCSDPMEKVSTLLNETLSLSLNFDEAKNRFEGSYNFNFIETSNPNCEEINQAIYCSGSAVMVRE
ncbi:hypothetical protein [Marixanthomonas spongiae]|uniref:Lipoprotein n=1 Tax=Marixanthomonas spongiae TaxID=2174845 RepID=A0A2U0I3Z5_9FLAO|nr:hypothetical protein [Marixanthomonas spongiae]PVW15794.1 hypothetical protein DDV96_05875 [Marixanthomonas spongiae]